jgi:hypothetical protein
MRRRSFLTAASLTAAGLAASTAGAAQGANRDSAQGSNAARRIARHRQDAWFDALPGTHRLFIDATSIAEAASAVGFAWNFLLTSKSGYNLKDADQAVIICLRHDATEVSVSNVVWRKYAALRTLEYKNPETGKMVRGGNVFRPGSTDPKSADEPFTLDGLARRGVHFAICGLAARGLAGTIAGAKATPDRIEEIMDELVKSMPATAHVMASGILATQRAGEYGYTVVRA